MTRTVIERRLKNSSAKFIKISPADVTTIFKLLQDNDTVEELDLKDNRDYIDSIEVAIIDGLDGTDAFRKKTKLQKLNLDNNRIGTGGDTLFRRSKTRVDPACLMRELAEKTSITHLFLRNNWLNDGDVIAICDTLIFTGQLKMLNLDNNMFTLIGVKYLAKAIASPNNQLEHLDLNSNFIGGDGAIELFKSLNRPDCKLKKLVLQNNGVRENAIYSIADALRKNQTLKHLDLFGNSIALDQAITLALAIRDNKTLTEFYGLECYSNLNKVLQTVLQFRIDGQDNTANTSVLNDLLNNSKEIKITPRSDVIGIHLTPKTISETIQSAKYDKASSLRLRDNRDYMHGKGHTVGDTLISALEESTMPDLLVLRLENNELTATQIDCIFRLLKKTGISWIYLGNNPISDEVVKRSIIPELVTNRCLSFLDLYHTGLGDLSASEFAVALTSPDIMLETLNLSSNCITDRGAQALASKLHEFKTLTTLDIGNNRITAIGALDLAIAALESPTVIEIKGLEEFFEINNTLKQGLDEKKSGNGTHALRSLLLLKTKLSNERQSQMRAAQILDNNNLFLNEWFQLAMLALVIAAALVMIALTINMSAVRLIASFAASPAAPAVFGTAIGVGSAATAAGCTSVYACFFGQSEQDDTSSYQCNPVL